jgi:enamine deaminase RidA (YjgF/YER057c/UK114 family)
VIHTEKVPPARVLLSQAIRVGDWVFASGQLGNEPQTGELAEYVVTDGMAGHEIALEVSSV